MTAQTICRNGLPSEIALELELSTIKDCNAPVARISTMIVKISPTYLRETFMISIRAWASCRTAAFGWNYACEVRCEI